MPYSEKRMFVEMMNQEFAEDSGDGPGHDASESDEAPETSADQLAALGVQVNRR